jgi:alkylation response protein AidB-like acyl-CoA dehydrogenase
MDLTFTNKQTAFRQEIHDWLAVNVPAQPLQTFDTAEGFAQHREWEATLNKGRWGMVTWPEELGGRGCDLIEWLIFEEEYYRARAPLRVNQNGIFLLGPTLMEYGTEEQKARILPKMASGEEVWAQGWSEPNAGSDMAAIRSSTARLEGDKYVINGQKTWSTRAVWADWCFGMFRTDPDSERHHGLTFILVPLGSPGITVRPIPQLDGLPGFAEIFFDNVEVSVDNRLGDEGRGRRLAGGHGHRGIRAWPDAAFPRPLPGDRPSPGGTLPGKPGRRRCRSGGSRCGDPRLPGCRELLPDHLPDRLSP